MRASLPTIAAIVNNGSNILNADVAKESVVDKADDGADSAEIE